MFCQNCGSQIPDNASFCTSCGAKLTAPAAPVTAPPVAPAPQQTYAAAPVAPAPQQTYAAAPAYPNQQSYAAQQNNVAQNQPPMKWYKFLIYFGLWAGAVLNALTAISSFMGTQYGESVDQVYAKFGGLRILDICHGVLLLVFAAFLIFVRFQLAGYKKNAPQLLLIAYAASFVIEIIYLILGFVVLSKSDVSFSDVVGSSGIGSVISMVVVILTNKVYFDKRKHLFVN